jgi:hypothetical protein
VRAGQALDEHVRAEGVVRRDAEPGARVGRPLVQPLRDVGGRWTARNEREPVGLGLQREVLLVGGVEHAGQVGRPPAVVVDDAVREPLRDVRADDEQLDRGSRRVRAWRGRSLAALHCRGDHNSPQEIFAGSAERSANFT